MNKKDISTIIRMPLRKHFTIRLRVVFIFSALVILISHSLLFSFSAKGAEVSRSSPISVSTSTLEKEAERISDDIQLRQELLASLTTRLERSRENLLEVYSKYEASNNDYIKKKQERNKNLREIYEGSSISFFDVLFNARSLTELFEGLKYVNSINKYNAQVMSELRIQRDQLQKLQEEAQVKKQDEFIMVEVEKSELNSLKLALAEKQLLLSRLREDERKRVESRARRKANSKYTKYALPLNVNAEIISATIKPSNISAVTSSNMPKEYIATGAMTEGISSWYGDAFHGMRTANGETYNQNDFTAASRTLPFNTFLAVTYKGKTIIVRINDRGPYIPPRVLDLSKAAAKELGLGLGSVKMEIVTPIGEGTVISPTSSVTATNDAAAVPINRASPNTTQ